MTASARSLQALCKQLDDAANRATGATLRRQTAETGGLTASARPEPAASVIGGTGTDVALRSDSTRSHR